MAHTTTLGAHRREAAGILIDGQTTLQGSELVGFLARKAFHYYFGLGAEFDHVGALAVEVGKTKGAREVLIQRMDQLNLDQPEANYWYALRHIAEQYGENELASADYNQVKKPKKPTQVPGSSYRLAQNRIAAMNKSVEESNHE